MAKIFISHSSLDKDFVRELSSDLIELGHKPWLDEWEIKVGECIVTKVEEGISNSDYIIIVLTPNSVASGWVEREWKTVYWSEIQFKKIMVLPVLLKECEIPTLLKTKKYADFRGKYAIGFSQLVQSIIPVDIEKDAKVYIDKSVNDKDISFLISKIHSRQIPLSQAIAESIPLGMKHDDRELIEFCRNELSGWDSRNNLNNEKLSYRLIEMYCSFVQINMQYFGWNGNASNLFSYMEQDSEHFFPYKLLFSEPISSIEQKQDFDSQTTVMSWTQPITDFIKEPSNPNAKVFCYAHSSSYKNVYEAIRIELTKRLLNLLPDHKV